MKSMELLKGKNAIITGAAQGIGKAIAKEFFNQGANIFLTDINEELGKAAAKSISKKTDNEIIFKKMDVTSKVDVAETFEYAVSRFGQVDILVNNAAILINHEIKKFPLDDWNKVFEVNMTGTFICSQRAITHMIEKGIKGCILNIGSAAARKADTEHSAYSASKAAMLEFARVLALEVGKYGIRVNSILPGATETEMLKGVFKKVRGLKEEIIHKTVLGKLGQPRDQANAAVFLCSDMASHITGEYLIVSGGEFFNP
jgi:NAD(P)-dependent dehydrogenase (short-subunit alcohol dehydrogenase family)